MSNTYDNAQGEYRNKILETLTWEKEFVIKEGQTASLSLLFKSSTDTLIIFIFSSLLDQSIPDFVFAL